MSAALGDFICGIQQSVAQGFRSLPAILGGSLLILALAQANYNLLFFFVGLWILTPLWTLLLNGLLELGFSRVGGDISWWAPETSGTAQCSIFSTSLNGQGQPMSAVPSFWLSMMFFFYTYLFCNAYELYKMPASDGAKEVQVKARQFKAATSMAILFIVGIATIWLRFGTSSCETLLGVIISASSIGIAVAWYNFMKSCGLGRLDDVFGVSNRIVPVRQDPIACVNTS
jgi:hypothetical protein